MHPLSCTIGTDRFYSPFPVSCSQLHRVLQVLLGRTAFVPLTTHPHPRRIPDGTGGPFSFSEGSLSGGGNTDIREASTGQGEVPPDSGKGCCDTAWGFLADGGSWFSSFPLTESPRAGPLVTSVQSRCVLSPPGGVPEPGPACGSSSSVLQAHPGGG